MSQCITVSVVSHGHDTELKHLLRDLASHDCGYILQVIVTLNISSVCEIDKWIKTADWPFHVDVLMNSVPQGFSRNHNQAFNLSRGLYFCVVNPDVELDFDPFPQMLLKFLDAAVGCVYPFQITSSSEPQDYKRPVPSPQALLARHCKYLKRWEIGLPKLWVNASFLLFSNTAYANLGGFDERYFMYCEDVDICLRMKLSGYRLVAAEGAVVRHTASFASRGNIKHLFWHLISLFRLWTSSSYRDCKVELYQND